jgi:hypothetical protein
VEGRGGGVAFGVEEVESVGAVYLQAKLGSHGIEGDGFRLRAVYATEVDGEDAVDEHEHVIVSGEGEGLSSQIGEGSGGLHGEGKIVTDAVAIGSLVAPPGVVDEEHGLVVVGVADGVDAGQRKIYVSNKGDVNSGRVAVPLVEVGLNSAGAHGVRRRCVDRLEVRVQVRSHDSLLGGVLVLEVGVRELEVAEGHVEGDVVRKVALGGGREDFVNRVPDASATFLRAVAGARHAAFRIGFFSEGAGAVAAPALGSVLRSCVSSRSRGAKQNTVLEGHSARGRSCNVHLPPSSIINITANIAIGDSCGGREQHKAAEKNYHS